MKYWEIIADNLSKAGWSWGCVSAVDSSGRTPPLILALPFVGTKSIAAGARRTTLTTIHMPRGEDAAGGAWRAAACATHETPSTHRQRYNSTRPQAPRASTSARREIGAGADGAAETPPAAPGS